MGKQKKWNNQGGSGWGDKPKKPKKDLPNIPQFDKLPESNTVSFRLSKPRRNTPNYRELGDEIWTDWEPFDDYELPEVENGDLDMPEIRDDIRDIPNTLPPKILPDLVPVAAYKEYEIVVKYKSQTGQLVLTISSGQAYAARYQINDPKLDFAIAVASSEPIAIGSYVGLTNLIQLNSPLQDPAFSLYKWVRSVLDIATDNDGNSGDPILDNLPTNEAIALPSTSFSWQNQQFDLFYGSGIKPTQLCLHCVDDVVKFRPNQPVNAAYLWTVTITGDPLPLCKSLTDLPIVFISIAPGYPTEIDPNNNPNGDIFGLRISIDEPIAVDLPVWFGIGGTADPQYWYFLIGYGADENNIPAFIIPANSQYMDVLIQPIPNPGQTDPTNIDLFLVANPSLYEIGFGSQTVDLVPVILPVVSISLAPNSPSSIDVNNIGGNVFIFRISIDTVQQSNFLVKYSFTGTADPQNYTVPNLTINNSFVIPAGDSYVDVYAYPDNDPVVTEDKTIVLNLLPDPVNYDLGTSSQTTTLAFPADYLFVRRTVNNPSPYPRFAFQNINSDIYVYGSNFSQATISPNDRVYNPSVFAPNNISIPPYRDYLIQGFNPSLYLYNYGISNNYYRRFFDGSIADPRKVYESFYSKKLLKDFLQSKNLRYLTIHFFYEINFDFYSYLAPQMSAFAAQLSGAANIPAPSANYADYLNDIAIAFGKTDKQSAGILPNDSYISSAYDNLPYPANSLLYASGFSMPIQMDVFTSQSSLTSITNTASRLINIQSAIEFDSQSDPDLIDPRIVPVVTKFLEVNNGNRTYFTTPVPATYFPFQQIS